MALALLGLFLPVMVGIAALLWLSGTRRILYCDKRVGLGGRTFTIWKFRTMRDAGDNQAQAGYDHRRVTWLGAGLRRYRLDELPQLFNVLRGDLNLVGMRPPLPAYVMEHPRIYQGLLAVRPGLTGLASVRFHRIEDALMHTARDVRAAHHVHARHCLPVKARLDRFYLRHRSVGLDLWILLQTLSVFLPRGMVPRPMRPSARVLDLCEGSHTLRPAPAIG